MNSTSFLRLAFAAATTLFAASAGARDFAPNPNGTVRTIQSLPDGDILVTGSFSQIAGVVRDNAARLNADGSLDEGLPEVDGLISGFAVQPDGKFFISGSFNQVSGTTSKWLARLNADGSLDTSFVVPVLDAAAAVLLVQSDGKIPIYGGFTQVGGTAMPKVARLNADGSLDPGFVADPAITRQGSQIVAAALQSDGKIVVGGGFCMTDNCDAVRRLLRLNPDGSLDSNFVAPTSIDRQVTGVLVQSDGALVINGDFTLPYNHLARFNSDGSLDSGFDAAQRLRFLSIVKVLQQDDGKLLVGGGNLYDPNDLPPAVVRLNADGSPDASFADPRIIYSNVRSMALQADGKVLAGGFFYEVGGRPRNNLTRLNPDGSIDIPPHAVTPAPGANGGLSPATPQEVLEGDTTRFTILPDAGYHLDVISGCGGAVLGAYYVTGPITADCTVTASFASGEQAFTVTPQLRYGAGTGSISPSEPQAVRFGQTASFTLTPDPDNNYLGPVSGCDGTLDGSVYTTAPISAECTVSAEFRRPTSAVANGGPYATGIGAPFASPLSVRVTSFTLDGTIVVPVPLAGVPVHFEAPAAGASAILSSLTAITDADGIASVNAVANDIAGGYAVRVVADGLPQNPVYLTLSNESLDGSGLDLNVTLSTDPPPACGTATNLDVAAGTPINYCFTVVNRGPVPLNYHTLNHWLPSYFWSLDHAQAFFLKPMTIAPGATLRYNKVMPAGSENATERFTWTALAEMPSYWVDTNATQEFIDISAGGSPLGLDMKGVATLDLPFSIKYYGMLYTDEDGYRLCVHNSGTLRLLWRGVSTTGCPEPDGFRIPPFVGDNDRTDADYINGILPHWDLLGNAGDVYVKTLGDAPNRRLVVQWQEMSHGTEPDAGGGITFEALIDEADGTIHFVYPDLDFDIGVPGLNYGGSATVGLIGNDGDLQTIPPPPLRDGESISLRPTPAQHTAVAEVQVRVGTPRIQMVPSAVSASASIGTTTSRSIAISNNGSIDLDWSLDRAAPSAHFPSTRRWLAPASDFAAPPGVQASAESSRATSREVPNEGLTVPAYGAMQEGTFGYPQVNWFVGFDAAAPDFFMPVPLEAYGVMAGDFVGDDFTKEYVLYESSGGGNSLYTVDLEGAEGYVFIGDSPLANSGYPGMAWDRTTDILYVTAGSILYTIDRSNGQLQRVGDITADDGRTVYVSDIAISPGGLMYGIDPLNDALLAIDKTTGLAAIVGSLGVDLVERNSIDFDDVAGTLYLAAFHSAPFAIPGGADSGGIYTIDLVTGLARLLSRYPLSPNNNGYLQVDALAIARAGGQCAFPGEISWLRNDVNNGSTAPGQQSPVTLTLDASGLGAGEYAANVCISSNDRSRSLLAVPVAFTVSASPANDAIFRNGFDGATP